MNRPDNTLIEFADTQQTMTSLEIAEVTGKQHKNVLQSIRKMEPAWEKITGLKFQLCMKISELANGVKKENPYYVLTKTETLYIATKFNDEARAKLVIRWEQLEHERQEQPEPATVMAGQPASVMQQPSRRQILLMALQAEEECQRLREDNRWHKLNMIYMSIELGRRYQIIQQYAPEALHLIQVPEYEPRPESYTTPAPGPARLTSNVSTYTVTQLAQEYGMKAVSFNNLLQQLGIQHNAGGHWVITPDYAGRDFTQTKQITVHDNGRAVRKPFTVWTEAGRKFIHDMLSRQGIKPVTGEGGSV